MLSVVAGIKAAAERNSVAPALITGSRIITHKDLLDLVGRISNVVARRQLEPLSKVFINIADPDIRLAAMIASMHCGMIPFALLHIGDLEGDVDYDLVIGTPQLFTREPAADIVLDQHTLTGPLSDGRLRDFPDRGEDDILFVASTTGTTGRRKLVAEIHGGFKNKNAPTDANSGSDAAGASPDRRRLSASDRVMSTLGDVTKAGVISALRILMSGAVLVRFDRNPPECLRLINVLNVTRISSTPATMVELMDCMQAEGIRCPSVQRIILVGSLFQKALVERLERNFDAEFSVGYGTSETGVVSDGRITAASFELGYVGELVPHIKMVSVGSEADPKPLVALGGRNDLSPYYAAGKLLSEPSQMHPLPDIGYMKGVSLYLLGRDDEVFNFSGNKTAYSVIEGALKALAGVKDVGIVGGSAIGDIEGVVIAVVSTGETSQPDMVACVCRTVKVAGAANHLYLFATEKIARNSMGKVDRAAVVSGYNASQGLVT